MLGRRIGARQREIGPRSLSPRWQHCTRKKRPGSACALQSRPLPSITIWNVRSCGCWTAAHDHGSVRAVKRRWAAAVVPQTTHLRDTDRRALRELRERDAQRIRLVISCPIENACQFVDEGRVRRAAQHADRIDIELSCNRIHPSACTANGTSSRRYSGTKANWETTSVPLLCESHDHAISLPIERPKIRRTRV